jgi:hypothetical protein
MLNNRGNKSDAPDRPFKPGNEPLSRDNQVLSGDAKTFSRASHEVMRQAHADDLVADEAPSDPRGLALCHAGPGVETDDQGAIIRKAPRKKAQPPGFSLIYEILRRRTYGRS